MDQDGFLGELDLDSRQTSLRSCVCIDVLPSVEGSLWSRASQGDLRISHLLL